MQPLSLSMAKMVSKGVTPPQQASPKSSDCCMCGDHGLPHELFRCKICHFRCQHRYCSNLYPKSQSYRICNWCLKEGGGKTMKEETHNSTNNSNKSNDNSSNVVKFQRGAFPLHLNNPIKKQRSSNISSGQNKTVSGCSKESIRWSRSDEISKPRQVFRGKVRRYKLLEEVSS